MLQGLFMAGIAGIGQLIFTPPPVRSMLVESGLNPEVTGLLTLWVWLLLVWFLREGLCSPKKSTWISRCLQSSCLSVHCIWDAGWRPKTWNRNIFSTLYATRSWARGSRWGSRLCMHTCPAPSHHLHPRPFLSRCRAHSAMRICVSLVLPSLPHLGLVLLWSSLLDSGFLCHSTDKSPSSTTGIVLKQTPYLCSLFH